MSEPATKMARKHKCLIATLLCAVSLSGCKLDDVFPTSPELQRKVEAQQQTISTLQKEVEALSAQIAAQHSADNTRISNIETKVLSLWLDSIAPKAAQLSVTERNYSVLDTNLGKLLFVVQDIGPYANGVKLKLKIGNPNAVIFDGIKMNFSWGKDAADAVNHNKEIDVPTTFQSGAWTLQDVILSPAKPSEMGYLSVSVSPNQIGLRQPYPSR